MLLIHTGRLLRACRSQYGNFHSSAQLCARFVGVCFRNKELGLGRHGLASRFPGLLHSRTSLAAVGVTHRPRHTAHPALAFPGLAEQAQKQSTSSPFSDQTRYRCQMTTQIEDPLQDSCCARFPGPRKQGHRAELPGRSSAHALRGRPGYCLSPNSAG
jgi:hypothetical protein